MNKNGVIAVVVVVAAIVLVGLWAMRSGQGSGVGGDCSAPPSAPTGVAATADGRMVTVKWDPPPLESGVTAYIIEAWQPDQTTRSTFIAAGNVTSFRREAPPAVYNAQVFARNACGTSNASEQITVTVR